ncbi:MAG: YceI family protein [Deltaproteobacteria bacterium]|nr:YceI family protein [Deltaproteobacteria bacterium]
MRSIKTLITTALAAGLLLAGLGGAASAASYKVDNAHTSVIFKASHLGIGTFYGRFNKVDGSVAWDAAAPDKSAFTITVDADSVFTADKKRDTHLKSPDFFNTKQFPTITLKSTAVKPGAKDTFEVTADLTMKGVTKTITFTAKKTGEGKDPWGGERVGFEGSFTVNRLDYGVSYMPEGLGKDVTLIVAFEAVKE